MAKILIERIYCDNCDGCGWHEGGRGVIKTHCINCNGSGVVTTYTCSKCRKPLSARDWQDHIPLVHPIPKKKKKPLTIVQATRREKLRKPTALERKQIRQAIADGKNAL